MASGCRPAKEHETHDSQKEHPLVSTKIMVHFTVKPAKKDWLSKNSIAYSGYYYDACFLQEANQFLFVFSCWRIE
jgi:hypothetical protein